MKRVIVTGGAGFIGSHVVELYLSGGYDVHVIDNLSSGVVQNVRAPAVLHQLDIRSHEARRLVSELAPNTIVHTAAQISVRESMNDPANDTEINVQGLINILQGIKEPRQTSVTFLSTGGAIYGEQENFPASENHPIKPESIYGLSKWVGEQYLGFWSRVFGLPVCILRLANVYGPRQSPHGEAGVVAIFMNRLLTGEAPRINGTGDQTRDFVFVGDVARAVFLADQEGARGTFNIGTGKETSVNELYQAVISALGLALRPITGPALPGEQMRSSIDSRSARQAFGWIPKTQLDQGIALTAEWFRNSTEKLQ